MTTQAEIEKAARDGSNSGTIRKPVANAEEKTGIHSVCAKNPFSAWSVSESTKLPKNPPSASKMTQRAHSALRAVDHAIHEQQKAETGIGERRGKRRGISEALERAVKKEAALKVKEHAARGRRESRASRPGSRRRARARRSCQIQRENNPAGKHHRRGD